MRQVYRLLGLVKKWGSDRVERACQRALDAEAVDVNLISHPPTDPDRCDACGGALVAREDDTPTAVRATSASTTWRSLLAAFAWYHVFKPPKTERFTRLRKRAIRRREMLRAFYLLLSLCFAAVLAPSVYSLTSGKGHPLK